MKEKSMNYDSNIIERRLNNLLEVCLYSGWRARGIFNVMDENRDFMENLLDKPETRSRFIWMEDVLTDNDIFCESLIAALRLTFPEASAWRNPVYSHGGVRTWPGRNYGREEIIWSEEWMRRNSTPAAPSSGRSFEACYRRVMVVCQFTDKLLDANRQMLETLLAHPDALDPWVQSWSEDFDLFFMDVREAADLEEMYKERPDARTVYRPWPGEDKRYLKALLVARQAQPNAGDRK